MCFVVEVYDGFLISKVEEIYVFELPVSSNKLVNKTRMYKTPLSLTFC